MKGRCSMQSRLFGGFVCQLRGRQGLNGFTRASRSVDAA